MLKPFLFRILRAPLVLGLLLVVLGAQASTPAPGILVLGDSISAAYGMSLEQGWVALLERQLAETHPGSRVVNASISGETSGGGLRRLPALLEEHQPQLVIIQLGGNDGLRGYPINKFRDNLRQMATLSKDAGASVLFLAMEIPPNYGSRYTSAFRDSFTVIAEETDSVLGPFLLDGVATEPGMMQADGIHPTATAQPRLLQNVLPTLMDMLAAP
jgi:acyl-CoA thioesterase-1